MNDMSKDKEQLLAMLKQGAFFRENITLSSGKTSDYYIDARRITLTPQGAYLCAKIILRLLEREPVDAIGGPTLGADPLVGAIAVLSFQENRPISTFIIRKAPKSHGKQQQLEGPILKEGARVVLLDDVATTGKALIQSIEVLRKMNILVEQAICIVDRQEGAREALEKLDCRLVSLFTASDFLKG